MPVTIKEGASYDPRRAERQRALSLRKVKERWVELRCESCAHEETGWERTEPEPMIPTASAFPFIDVWSCPVCRGMMEPKKRRARASAGSLHNILPLWEEFTLENLGHTPIRITSREEYARVLREHGVVNQHGVGGDRGGNFDLWGERTG